MRRSHVTLLCCVGLAVAAMVLLGVDADAWEQYSENRDATNCRSCHGDFLASPYTSLADGSGWGNSLHNVHRNSMLGGDCDTSCPRSTISPEGCHDSGQVSMSYSASISPSPDPPIALR